MDNLDLQPLTRLINRAEVVEFTNTKSYQVAHSLRWSKIVIPTLPLFSVGIGVAAVATAVSSSLFVLFTCVALTILLMIVQIKFRFSSDYNRRLVAAEKKLRLQEFIDANEIKYTPTVNDPLRQGTIFGHGDVRWASDVMLSKKECPFEVGQYQCYDNVLGKKGTTYRWAYLCIKLKKKIPHMMLDAKRNDYNASGMPLTTLSDVVDKDQTLRLEGDFNKYFTLYAPKEYERDALEIFTPDFMALLIDNASQWEVELVDDELYVYAPNVTDLFENDTLLKFCSIVQTVGQKSIRRTERYRDSKLPYYQIDAVAAQGKRLKIKNHIWGGAIVVIITVMIAIWYIIWRWY